MQDRSRRPYASPRRTDDALEAQVVALRYQHPCWGGRKLTRVLRNRGHDPVPAPSTITHLLHRHGLLSTTTGGGLTAWQRFEHAAPNELWQMDFKGTVQLGSGRCDPLTVLDDHSRYNLALRAVPDMRTTTVQAALTETFRRYGLPVRMNMDNGSPSDQAARGHRHGGAAEARYRPSARAFPEVLPAIDYAPQDQVLRVHANGVVSFQGHAWKVSNALRGHLIAARPRDDQDGLYDLYFAHHRMTTIDLHDTD